ncbi:MAG TPA: DNA mismatch endonuclease Vsr [Candidatus Aminicenantes bacterium]|nr:DNA mismatch endonuclease Vsr [Candidatus Aminicenantes bacterium]HRY65567.1 DNA mismatch endonuclease Vsr [Candidatus Aminicenantes bacterium]HRZ72545.1 DNA mismatch endonuclease Vsr [Candidatus Aminicenantes bacterium]
MTDRIPPAKRSWNMSRIRSRNTMPEIRTRSQLHHMGFRFSLTPGILPGSPDILLPKYKIAIFVHGCYWHRHKSCKYAYMPKSRTDFWKKKFVENQRRDIEIAQKVQVLGWTYFTIWECEVENPEWKIRLLQLVRRKPNIKKEADRCPG